MDSDDLYAAMQPSHISRIRTQFFRFNPINHINSAFAASNINGIVLKTFSVYRSHFSEIECNFGSRRISDLNETGF